MFNLVDTLRDTREMLNLLIEGDVPRGTPFVKEAGNYMFQGAGLR